VSRRGFPTRQETKNVETSFPVDHPKMNDVYSINFMQRQGRKQNKVHYFTRMFHSTSCKSGSTEHFRERHKIMRSTTCFIFLGALFLGLTNVKGAQPPFCTNWNTNITSVCKIISFFHDILVSQKSYLKFYKIL